MSRFPTYLVFVSVWMAVCSQILHGQKADPCTGSAIKLDRSNLALQIDAAGAGENNPREHLQEEPDVIRVHTDLVVTEFDVRDRSGKRITGLGAADFLVEEDGVPQKIEAFFFGRSQHSIGRSIVLIIDYSQSQRPYIDTSIRAAKVLVDLLDPIDKMAIVTDDVELLADFTSDKSVLAQSLERLRQRVAARDFGKSRQMTALYGAVQELFEAGDKRPVVILQTDGDEMARLLAERPSLNRSCSGQLRRFSDLTTLLERAGTTVYSIIPGVRPRNKTSGGNISEKELDLEKVFAREAKDIVDSGDPKKIGATRQFYKHWAKWRARDAAAIAELSRLTGGNTEYLDDPEAAGEVYLRILNEMNQRYLIGYYPTNRAADGKRRAIKIDLRPGLPYLVNGKKGYTPRRASK